MVRVPSALVVIVSVSNAFSLPLNSDLADRMARSEVKGIFRKVRDVGQ